MDLKKPNIKITRENKTLPPGVPAPKSEKAKKIQILTAKDNNNKKKIHFPPE